MLSDVVIPKAKPADLTPIRCSGLPFLILLGAHVALGPIMLENEILATVHATATVVVAVGLAAISPWLEHIAYSAAYVTGAEVLWRMTDAQVPHELGKYVVMAVLGIGLLRLGRQSRRHTALPVAYFAILVPSIVLTVQQYEISTAREEISFNMSGPACLAVSYLFFSRLSTTWAVIRRLLWSMLAAITATASIAAYSTRAAAHVEFSLSSSNFVTAGGFGPNQVSAMLGLGALIAIVVAVKETTVSLRAAGVILSLWMLVQSVLTFSRGGIVNAAAAIVLASLYSLRSPKRAATLVVSALALVLFSGFFVYPRLVAFTGGVLEQRFGDYTLSERGELLEADLQAWRQHPVLGVGPGVGKLYRTLPNGEMSSAHTEFTRLLGEHGVGGIVALALLVAMVVRAYRAAPGPSVRAWVLLLASWSLTEMAHGAMRLAAVSFAFGLIAVGIDSEKTARQAPSSDVVTA